MQTNLTLDQEQVDSLPILKTSDKRSLRTLGVFNGIINLQYKSEQFFVSLQNLRPLTEDIGEILNYEVYKKALKNAALNQEILDYQKFK